MDFISETEGYILTLLMVLLFVTGLQDLQLSKIGKDLKEIKKTLRENSDHMDFE